MARYSKSDFLDVARGLRAEYGTTEGAMRLGVYRAAESMANLFQQDNRLFDREHFLAMVRWERRLGPPDAAGHATNNAG